MTIDLTHLTATQVGTLAVVATLLSAGVASLTALLIARINASSARLIAGMNAEVARTIARDAGLREYRRNALEGFLKLVDGSFLFISLAATYAKAGNLRALEDHLGALSHERSIMHSTSYVASAMSEPQLQEAVTRFLVVYEATTSEAVRLLEGLRLHHPADTAPLEAAAQLLMPRSFNVRMAAEDFICSTDRSREALAATFACELPFPDQVKALMA